MNRLKLLVFLNLFNGLVSSPEENAFAMWKQSFKKEYESPRDEAIAFKNFCENRERNEIHNKRYREGKETYRIALLGESDKALNILSRSFNLAKVPPRKVFNIKPRDLSLPSIVPKFLNYTSLGFVNPVQNQKNCGSCFAFAACGAIEGQIFKKTKQSQILSEQQLVDCVRTSRTVGCKGGVVADVFEYIRLNGVTLNETYSYKANDTFKCSYNPKTSVTKISSYSWPTINEDDLIKLLVAIGPVVVVIDGSRPTFMQYKSGVYSDPTCSTTNVNHAMLLTGYGTDDNLGKYWLIKNTFSTKWGENGYMRLKRGVNQCGILVYITYALL